MGPRGQEARARDPIGPQGTICWSPGAKGPEPGTQLAPRDLFFFPFRRFRAHALRSLSPLEPVTCRPLGTAGTKHFFSVPFNYNDNYTNICHSQRPYWAQSYPKPTALNPCSTCQPDHRPRKQDSMSLQRKTNKTLGFCKSASKAGWRHFWVHPIFCRDFLLFTLSAVLC